MTAPACRYCAEPATHGDTCCWCWVVELARDPFDGHLDCRLAARRLVPIRARFKTAIEATRENCIELVHEGLAQPLEAMPKILRVHFRRNPERALQAILNEAAGNLATAMKERIKS